MRSPVAIAVLIVVGLMSPALVAAHSRRAAPTWNPCGYRAHMWSQVEAVSKFVGRATSLTSDQAATQGSALLSGVFDISADYGYGIRLNKPLVHLLIGVVGTAEEVSRANQNGLLGQPAVTKPLAAAYRGLSEAWGTLKHVPVTCPKPTALPAPKKPTPRPAPPKPPTPKPAPVPGSITLFSQNGTGIQTTDYFTAPNEWTIDWSFDCSSFGSEGNFQIYVYAGPNNPIDVAVNALSTGDSGTAFEHQGGDVYLVINSECNWQVTAHG